MTKGEFTDIHITIEKKNTGITIYLESLNFGSSTFDRPNGTMTCKKLHVFFVIWLVDP